ncbi:MAG: class I SAM-dependent methyltransferase [Chloroflexi bacterium OHK40]
MSLRFHEIAEQHHRILNPFTEEQLLLLGELCRVRPEHRQLDLCCGKGEMLCRWAARHGHHGTGVDISKVFLAAARERAAELGVAERIHFVEADARSYPIEPGTYDIVSCIGATWIGGGLAGTLAMLRGGLRNRESLLLVGEPYWVDSPPPEAYSAIAGGDRELFSSLAGTHERIEGAGLELVELVLADQHGWDRYVAPQWLAVSEWLRAHPEDPDAGAIRALHERSRREYLAYTRRYLGWGVFVCRLA